MGLLIEVFHAQRTPQIKNKALKPLPHSIRIEEKICIKEQ
jgi:hypothetical protein